MELNVNTTLQEIKNHCTKRDCHYCELKLPGSVTSCYLTNTAPSTWELLNDAAPAQEPQTDAISPAHYQQGARQTLDEMLIIFGLEAVKAFCLCNVYKYETRAGLKNGAEDLAKADRYLTFYEHLCEYGHIKWDELEE